MDKQELAERLARRSRQSRGNVADKLDDLIYRLWKQSREDPKAKAKEMNTAPAKKS